MLLFLQILARSTFISHSNFHFHYSKKHRIKYFNKPVQLKRTESPIQKLNRKQESPVSLPSSPLTERERETFKIIDNRVWSINWQAHFTRYSIQSMAARRKRSGRISLTRIPDFRTRRNDHYSVRWTRMLFTISRLIFLRWYPLVFAVLPIYIYR